MLLGSTCKWDKGCPNNHLITIISNVMSSVMNEHDGVESRIEINLHADMVVVGNHATIFSDTGNKVDVIPLTLYYQSLEKVSIVDAAVQYTCQYMKKVYVLVFRNSLSVTSIDNNITLSFIMR